ncbi:Phage head-tail joining protein [compost metagenome]
MATGAGDLKDRVRFDDRAPDANGDPVGDWRTGFVVWARLDFLRGSEVAIQQRLEKRQPISVTVRDSAQVRTINPAMRMVNVRTGEIYNITAAAPARDAGFRNILAVSGGASG